MIENAKFTKSGSIISIIEGQEMSLPDNMENRHRAMLADWEASGNVIELYEEPVLTPEELRAQMPRKSMVEFRASLRKVKTSIFPNGIYAADINAMIDQIADLDLQEEARDYFNLGQYAERINPWVDIFGFMAGLAPAQIDVFWRA